MSAVDARGSEGSRSLQPGSDLYLILKDPACLEDVNRFCNPRSIYLVIKPPSNYMCVKLLSGGKLVDPRTDRSRTNACRADEFG